MNPSAHELESALEQVRSLQDLCLVKQRFYGYSGKARIVCAGLTVATAAVLFCFAREASPWTHLAGWGALLGVALAINYAALAYWFACDPEVKRDPVRLKPAIEALPPLSVGALLSVACVLAGHWQLLFPIWMFCFGLGNLASRHFLDRAMGLVGLFYLVSGAIVLLLPGASFTQPLVMDLCSASARPWAACSCGKDPEMSSDDPYASLKKTFHEPNRLAIVSALLPEVAGMTFGEIKQSCGLTDGNLSRHLKTLETDGVVTIHKAFVNNKPQTTVRMTDRGRQAFMEYLQALETVLKRASKALRKSGRERSAARLRRSPGTA